MKFKVIKIYIVDAKDKKDAINKVSIDPESLETTIVKPVEEKDTLNAKEQLAKLFGL